MLTISFKPQSNIQGNKGNCSKWGVDGWSTISHIQGRQTFLHTRVGGQTFSVWGGSGNNDVDGVEEDDVNEANILVSKASMISVGPSNFSYNKCL